MTIKVLIVDDSLFYRRQLRKIIDRNAIFSVIGEAENGEQAVAQALALRPDVITMDYQMPVLDGVAAIRKILASMAVPILMLSSLTREGATATLNCLEAGAVDFLQKPAPGLMNDDAHQEQHCEQLYRRLISATYADISRLPKSENLPNLSAESGPDTTDSTPAEAALLNDTGIILIGASTGGPAALTQLFKQLPARFPLPIIVVQHMPGEFTRAFADRLNEVGNLSVKEAEAGDRPAPGHAYVAPGGKQLVFTQGGTVSIVESSDRTVHKPSVDVTFASAARAFHSNALGVVLTGMGNDGCEGARLLKQAGSRIWAQDKSSALIYGMPAAVVSAQLVDAVVSLDELGERLTKAV